MVWLTKVNHDISKEAINMKNRNKKLLTIAGGTVIGLALVLAISTQFKKAPQEEDKLPLILPVESTEVTPNKPTEEKEVVVTIPTAPTSPPQETLPPQTDQLEQKIQADPIKSKEPDPPKLPEGTDIKNPEKQPEYESEEIEKQPEESTATPKGNSIPGFDNVPDGGANQIIEDSKMYENGNKIGIMD